MKVLILIVTYNGSKFIKECLHSINFSTINTEVLIIDNCSNDRSIEIIKDDFPYVELICNNKNLGFGKANNIGIKYAIENNYEYVFFLNQDTILEPNAIEKLLDQANKIKDFGFISPLHLSWSGDALEPIFEYFLRRSGPKNLLSNFFFKNESCIEIGFVNAAAWLIPVDTLKKIGGFNPIFPHYCEDIDFYNRLKFFEYKNYLILDSKIRHYSTGAITISQRWNTKVKREVFETIAKLTNINSSFIYSLFIVIFNSFKKSLIYLLKLKLNEYYFEVIVWFKLLPFLFEVISVRNKSKKGNAFLK
ncbi:glycosyltransferase family 2 protein [Algoriphagus sanaruensis]|uniref:Glycosyltransferase 2-like domain-containing protein n=1 Tax=Algoriphagus sanaruensis TaxID=1727163 RepID=A0A142EQT1_9BACT|nr:glycosyltransferase family 2 protein [Algoriphagus sanaruensis]AMQ57486.1 hypothetical protein AO498_13640 [Algoriphagus sanaruensis]